MKRKSSNSLAASVTLLASFVVISQAVAEPRISRAEVSDNSISIFGTGFGEKKQAAPILWAFGQDIRENGIQVPKEVGVRFGSAVPVGNEPGSNVWSRGTGATFSATTRTKAITHTYHAANRGWLGWPLAFGGEDTPYSNKAYISWRLKPAGDINSYKAVRISDINGDFDGGNDPYSPGEQVKIITSGGNELSGRIVNLDATNSLVHLEARTLQSTDSIGAEIIGMSSGASGKLRGDEFFRSSISGKYLRSYETINGGGTNTILSTNRWIAVQFDSTGTELRRGFETQTDSGYGVPYISDTTDWKLLESFINLSGDYGSGYISLNNSNIKWFKDLYIGDSKPKDAGPTISNLGWEPAGGTEVINVALNFGEIYFDNTPQRAVLSDQELFSQVRENQELQYISEWTDQKIVVDAIYGALNQSTALYIYVFDQNNNVNSVGFCIKNCDANVSPPSRIDLGVD